MFMQKFMDGLGRGFSGGRIEFRTTDGGVWTLGHGEPCARLRLRDAATLRRILRNPGLNFGETYMDGAWEPESGRLDEVLQIGVRFYNHLTDHARGRWLAKLLGWIGEFNDAARSRGNVAHHYDIDETLYRTFLDADMQYSCAYFADGVRTLEQAQQAKLEHIARKLDLKPGAQVLDIGCGWGGMALYLARTRGAHVLGVTLSKSQHETARRRAAAAGLSHLVEFRLQDYREVQGEFDGIVSVGMFEHVGRPQYPTFFAKVRQLLKPDGVALLHTIGRVSPPGTTNPWIRKYIFPGGYIPAASEVMGALENSGLLHNDLECWRLHYARTLEQWHARFRAHRARLAQHMGERFCRMWEFYLKASEANFRWGDLVVFHAQMAHRLDRVPLTRDYLYAHTAVTAHARAA